MPYNLLTTKRYDREFALAKRRGLDENNMFDVVGKLINGEKLPPKNRDHALKGNLKGTRECHVHPDWLLIYEKNDGIRLIRLLRTGTHADLYGK